MRFSTLTPFAAGLLVFSGCSAGGGAPGSDSAAPGAPGSVTVTDADGMVTVIQGDAVDSDGDGIVDGVDTDGDGQVDVVTDPATTVVVNSSNTAADQAGDGTGFELTAADSALPDGGGFVTEGEFVPTRTCEECQDFPAEPILADGVDAEAVNSFTPGAGAGPCITEPATITENGVTRGALYPVNWLRPRFAFGEGGGLTRITLSTPRQVNDLVAYTNNPDWKLPPDIWDALGQTTWDEEITVEIANSSGVSTSSFKIAPVLAGGSMVFWASTTNVAGVSQETGEYTTTLYGFNVGAEAVIQTLSPPDVEKVMWQSNGDIKGPEFEAPAGQARCVGCHTSTPDGESVAITDHWPWNVALADITGTVGASPAYVTPMGEALLNLPWQGVTTFSRDPWLIEETRIMVTTMGPRNMLEPDYVPTMYNTRGDTYQPGNANKGPDELVWFDLAAPGEVMLAENGGVTEETSALIADGKDVLWGVIARDGDTMGAVAPDWSHDGSTIAYTSTDSILDGHVGGGSEQGTADPTRVDIYSVPFNGGAGGMATPVPGASEAGAAEYYPDFSADDQYLAFNRVDSQTGYMFYRPDGEIYITRLSDGEVVRVAANDSASCQGNHPSGQLNSWPKWSPLVRSYEGKKYYFLVFASARTAPFELQIQGNSDKRASQLFMTAVVENADGSIETYPAVYMWNQEYLAEGAAADAMVSELLTSNLTPAWDEFIVPQVDVVIK